MKYEYEILKVGDADAIIIRQYINDESFIILIDAGNACNSATIKTHLKRYYNSTYIDLAVDRDTYLQSVLVPDIHTWPIWS